jgi:hypothetical protein
MQERTAGCKRTSSISLRILSAGCHDMLYMSYASLLHKTFHNNIQKRFTCPPCAKSTRLLARAALPARPTWQALLLTVEHFSAQFAS